MNKLTKGSIAAGAGLVLLLGGAGTFMAWNDEANIDGDALTAGNLTVTAAEATWTVNGTPVTNISDYRMVPGDTVVYSSDLTVAVDGDNLSVSPTLSGGSITPAVEGDAEDTALAAELGENAVLELTSSDGTTIQNDGTYPISAETSTITASATLNFAFDGDEANASQEGAVDLAGMAIEFEQNLNPAPVVE